MSSPNSQPPDLGPPGRNISGSNGFGGHPLRQFLNGQFLGIRSGEGHVAWLFFVYFLILASCHYAGKSVRDATYLNTLGWDKLPYAYLLVALISFPVLALYSRVAVRVSHRWLIVGSCAIQAAALVAFFWLYGQPRNWVPVAFYVWMTSAFGIAVSQLWSYANHVFDPRQARRLFAFVGAGGLLGVISGGQLATLMSQRAGTRHTLLAAAVLMFGIIFIVVLIERARRAHRTVTPRGERVERLRDAKGGLQAVRGSRLLALIAAIMLLSVAVGQMVDILFKWGIFELTDNLDERTAAFGLFFTVMGLLAFGFQLVFTQRIHRALGVGFGMRVLPSTVAAGTVLLLAAILLPVAVIPIIVVLLKLADTGLRHSIDQATRELLFLPVPSQMRRQAKAFIDVFVQRFAKGAAGLVLLPVALGWLTNTHIAVMAVAAMTLVLVVVWLWVIGITRREYVGAFRDGLKPGSAEGPASIDTSDVTTMTTLVQSLGSSDAREVLHGLELFAAHGQGRLVPPLLLHHDDAEVRRKTLDILADEGRTDATPLIEGCIGDEDPEVRSAAIQALACLQGEDATEMVVARLHDPDVRLRSAAVAHLLEAGDPEVAGEATEVLAAMLADADPGARAEAAKALGQIAEPAGAASLIALLYDDRQEVVREAIAAVRRRLERGAQNPMYVPILISLMGNRRLKHDAREAIVAYGRIALDALVLFMNSRDEQFWVRRAVPKTIALLGRPAAPALLASLSSSDAFLRSKVIQALAFLRGKHPGMSFKHGAIRRQIRAEAESYLRGLADLWAVSTMHQVHMEGPHAEWQSEGRVPTLLQQLLAQRMAASVANLFGLLQLILPREDVRAAYRSLVSGRASIRARALEYLDNTLAGSLRRDVFAIIDDAPVEDKLQRAGQVFGVWMEPAEDTLQRMLTIDPNEDPQGVAPVLGAIYTVYSDRVTAFYPQIRTFAAHSDVPLVRETAAWAAERVSGAEGTRIRPEEGGLPAMVAMAQIEMMVFLQNVDLFSFCHAEEVLRLAAIANESHFTKGEVIYRRNDPPDALYCVVEGRVELVGEEGATTVVGPQGRFGVVEILSGRLRGTDAVAAIDARVLVIEAEDFFDLLSNNIDIVKALFRQLTRESLDPDTNMS